MTVHKNLRPLPGLGILVSQIVHILVLTYVPEMLAGGFHYAHLP